MHAPTIVQTVDVFMVQARPHANTHALSRTQAYYVAGAQTVLSAVPPRVSILKACKPDSDSLSLSQRGSVFPSPDPPSLPVSQSASQRGAATVALGGHAGRLHNYHTTQLISRLFNQMLDVLERGSLAHTCGWQEEDHVLQWHGFPPRHVCSSLWAACASTDLWGSVFLLMTVVKERHRWAVCRNAIVWRYALICGYI